MLTLSDVYEALTQKRPANAPGKVITDVVIDSRQVKQGSLFVALKGEVRDGHAFVEEALARGAAAVIAEARVGMREGLGPSVHFIDVAGLQPSPEPPVPIVFIVPSSLKALQGLAAFWRRKFLTCQAIGITGSVGKSSTKELIAAVLRRRYHVLKSEGNLNNEIGLPLTLLQLDARHERAVLEMGMYALGEIRELCRIAQPAIGVVTNVGPSHLERLGSIERTAEAKSELPQALPETGAAILNGDDPRVAAMRAKTRARSFLYGLEPTNDLWADEIESHGLEGIGFVLHRGREHLHVRVPLLGRHSVHTALAAASVGLIENLSWEEILRGLQDVAAQLRLIAVPGENGTTILDDTYNASPSSSLAALNLLAELNGRKIAVLGDMLELGELELQGHQLVGGRAAEVVAILIAVGAKGRWIGDAARAAGLSKERVLFAEGNAQAVEILRQVMRAGDLILVKGSRGVKMEEIVAAIARPGENGTVETDQWHGL
ncbi:MAG: UDP-N-acetylmuramoyl-tripeptide--D-alanyl-D-alanine ligase [Chloroflexota bacterium]|nr:UDP-N-acetylmuramoyl-tripeptide--D-alanyl-D-alanine ligase [Chloroflexota bacterium]